MCHCVSSVKIVLNKLKVLKKKIDEYILISCTHVLSLTIITIFI